MDPTEFEDLATKSLEGAATENEQSRLKDLLTHDAKLQRRYDELLVLQKIFRAVAPGAGLCQVPAKSFPHHRMAELQRTASEKWPSFRKRILVVDDESTFTGPLKRNLYQTCMYLLQVVK